MDVLQAVFQRLGSLIALSFATFPLTRLWAWVFITT